MNTTGSYNHYSALRSGEDPLGIDEGGADRHGHLGFAATATAFGADVFNRPADGDGPSDGVNPARPNIGERRRSDS